MIERLSCLAGGQIIKGHIKSALDGGIKGREHMQLAHSGGDVFRVPASPKCGEVLCHLKAGGLGLAYDHRESGAFAYTVIAGIGVDTDKDVLCIMHGPCGDRKGMHRDTELIDIGLEDLHIIV